jgi:hypothetical protein
MEANSNLIDFGVTSAGYLLPTMISSNEVLVLGKNAQNNPYQIKLKLTQIRI